VRHAVIASRYVNYIIGKLSSATVLSCRIFLLNINSNRTKPVKSTLLMVPTPACTVLVMFAFIQVATTARCFGRRGLVICCTAALRVALGSTTGEGNASMKPFFSSQVLASWLLNIPVVHNITSPIVSTIKEAIQLPSAQLGYGNSQYRPSAQARSPVSSSVRWI